LSVVCRRNQREQERRRRRRPPGNPGGDLRRLRFVRFGRLVGRLLQQGRGKGRRRPSPARAVPVRESRFAGAAEPAERVRVRAAGQTGRTPHEETMVARVARLEPHTEVQRKPDDRSRR